MSDISKKTHPDLIVEMARLQALERQTLAQWHKNMGPYGFSAVSNSENKEEFFPKDIHCLVIMMATV